MKLAIIQQYINNYRRLITPFLNAGIGLESKIYRFEGGTLIVFKAGQNIPSNDENCPMSATLNEAMSRTGIFSPPEKALTVRGTVLAALGEYTVIAKDNNVEQWTLSQAQADVMETISDVDKAIKKLKKAEK